MCSLLLLSVREHPLSATPDTLLPLPPLLLPPPPPFLFSVVLVLLLLSTMVGGGGGGAADATAAAVVCDAGGDLTVFVLCDTQKCARPKFGIDMILLLL